MTKHQGSRSTTRRGLLVGAGALALGAVPAAASATTYSVTTWQPITAASGADRIRALQYLLWAKGIPVTFESTYGTATRASVAAFQRTVPTAPTGFADAYTLSKLCPTLVSGQSAGAVWAMQTLLNRHGYTLPLTSTTYSTQLDRNVSAFQAGHALSQAGLCGPKTWQNLFFGPLLPPLVALRQAGTGAAQWTNCGPVSMLSILLSLRKTPTRWDGLAADRAAAVQYLRYTTIGLADTAARNAVGTEFFEMQPAFAKYGVSCYHGGIEDTLRLARAGTASICGGNIFAMPYPKAASGPASHWVAVLGHNGVGYLVADPLTTATSDAIHVLSEAQLRTYAATNPGYYPGHPRLSPPSHNSVCLS